MSCVASVKRYLADNKVTPAPIPPPNTGTPEEKAAWLIQSTFNCVNRLTTPPSLISIGTNNCGKYSDPNNPANQNGLTPSILTQTGFLDWVNKNGMQCINRLSGVISGLDANLQLIKPSVSVTQTPKPCYSVCQSVGPESTMCFACVQNALIQNPSLCPNFNIPTADTTIFTESITDNILCNSCMTNTVSAINVNQMWPCITGVFPMTTAQIAVISILWILFALLLFGSIGYYVNDYRKKHAKDKKMTVANKSSTSSVKPENMHSDIVV